MTNHVSLFKKSGVDFFNAINGSKRFHQTAISDCSLTSYRTFISSPKIAAVD